jgi:hypothetical protein
MGFAVFHMEKVSSGGRSLGAHIDREAGQEHTFKNADPALKDSNVHFDTGYKQITLGEGIKQRIKEGYQGKKAIRKDAVKAMSMVFTGSHTEMKEIFNSKQGATEWIKANMNFVKNEFGRENILRFTLHLDEKTPHIHAVVVPLTKDGRLSAKEIMGNREQMSARQTRYAEQMKPFGLQRGVVGSKAIHNSEGWYLGQQKEKQEAILSDIPKFTLLDHINPSKYIETLTSGLKSLGKSKLDAELEAQRRSQQLQVATSHLNHRITEVRDLKLQLNIVNHKVNGYTLKPEFEQRFADLQNSFLQEKKRQELDSKESLGPDRKDKGFKR